MNTRSLFFRHLIILVVFLILLNVYLPIHYRKTYPKELILQFEPGVKGESLAAINKNKPNIVLIGDSTLHEGIDAEAFSRKLGIRSYALPIPGSATAAWYLVMKNILLEASHRPRYVIILFRDTMLTTPHFRTTGRYFALLDDYAHKNEPLLTELIYINQMGPLERFAEQYLPVYSTRWEIREDLDNFLRYKTISPMFNCARDCTQAAIASVLGGTVDMAAFNQMVNDSADGLYKPDALDFNKQIDRSFLPAMIELAEQNDMQLIFVRTRTLNYPTPEAEPLELREYINDLKEYVAGYETVHLMDFSQDPRIEDAFFVDSLHFNTYGKQGFTTILADEIAARFGR